ncbi:MAG: hypothetical protein MH213_12355 [Marinobacter sp.]|nr:hypothetical protein [Marinobacter sp.]
MIEAGGEGVVFPMASFWQSAFRRGGAGGSFDPCVTGACGLHQKAQGKSSTEKVCFEPVRTKRLVDLYRDILAAALSKLNWAWIYNGESLEDVQTIGPFCFWLLSEKGGQWQPVQDYLNNILSAFPQLPLTADPLPYSTQEEQTLVGAALSHDSAVPDNGLDRAKPGTHPVHGKKASK